LDELEQLAAHPKVVAIGEIGLDYYRDHAPRQLQIDVFQSQLELAARLKLPVVVHNRNASDDILSILHAWCSSLQNVNNPLWKRPGVLHSFSEDEIKAKQAILDNFMIGITGPVTFKNDKIVHKTAASIPLEMLLIETDSPFLSPHPFRGSRNEPARVRLVADKIAQLHHVDIKIISHDTTANADKLFN
jgi:TatD DNase family protein